MQNWKSRKVISFVLKLAACIMRASVSGYSVANRREARKLGLLRSKSSEAERERLEPLERNERVCGDIPTQTLILVEDTFFCLSLIAFWSANKYTFPHGEVTELAEGARLLSECTC
jgi:hypothetical protein